MTGNTGIKPFAYQIGYEGKRYVAGLTDVETTGNRVIGRLFLDEIIEEEARTLRHPIRKEKRTSTRELFSVKKFGMSGYPFYHVTNLMWFHGCYLDESQSEPHSFDKLESVVKEIFGDLFEHYYLNSLSEQQRSQNISSGQKK